jgi:hypothetical protein
MSPMLDFSNVRAGTTRKLFGSNGSSVEVDWVVLPIASVAIYIPLLPVVHNFFPAIITKFLKAFLKLISGPQRPIIQIVTWLRLLEELPRIKNSVVGL